MVFMSRLNPFRSHEERSQAPTSPRMQASESEEPTVRRDSIDEWLFVNPDSTTVPASRRSSIESHRGRGSIDSKRRRGSTDSRRRLSIESQRRSSLGDWEVVEDDNNHNVVEYLEDCNAPVQDPDCTCMTCVGFFECRADPQAAKKLHRAWHRQFRGLPAIEEDEECDEDVTEENGEEETEEDEDKLTIARPPRAHLAQSRSVHKQLKDEKQEEDPFSTHKRGSSKNYPMCDNGGSLLDRHKNKSWASSFANLFNYRY